MRKLTMKEMLAVAGGYCYQAWSPYSGYSTVCVDPKPCTNTWSPYTGYVCR